MNAHWPTTKLSEVLIPTARAESVDREKAYRLLGIRLEGRGPFLRETVLGTQTSASKLYRVEAGDFIYSRLFACRGAFGVIDKSLDGCFVSGEFPTFRAVPNRVNLDYLKYWFRLPDVIASVDEKCTGSTPLTRNRFKEHFFLGLEMPLPPLPEQRRIVARIEELAVKVEEARGLRRLAVEEAEALFVAVLARTCSGEGIIADESTESAADLLNRISVRTWDGHVKARKRKPTALPAPPTVPKTWLVLDAGKLQEAGAILDIQDGNHGSDYPRKVEFGERGVPFVTAKQLEGGAVRINDAPRLPMERAKRLRIGFSRGGDVLLTHNASVGEVAVAPDDAGDFLLGTSVTYWRCNPVALHPRYLYHFMRSQHFQGQLAFIMKQTTRNQVSVLKQVNLWICYPPISEQRRIAKELDELQTKSEELCHLQIETAFEIDALMPSILDRAFKGEL